MFSRCLCARYQANPKESHLIAVKRIFRYLKGARILVFGIQRTLLLILWPIKIHIMVDAS